MQKTVITVGAVSLFDFSEMKTLLKHAKLHATVPC